MWRKMSVYIRDPEMENVHIFPWCRLVSLIQEAGRLEYISIISLDTQLTSNAKIENINVDNMALAKMNCQVENDEVGNQAEENKKAEYRWQYSIHVQRYLARAFLLKPVYHLKMSSLLFSKINEENNFRTYFVWKAGSFICYIWIKVHNFSKARNNA